MADAAVKTSIIFFILIILKFTLLNHVLSQIRSLSIVTHLMLIPINIPGTVMIFYSKIFEIVKFDIMEDLFKFDVILDWIFNFDNVPVNAFTDALGYSSHFIITNLGPIFVFFVILLALQLIFKAVMRLCSNCLVPTNCIMRFTQKWTNYFEWNGSIRFYNEVYMCLCFSVFFNMNDKFRSM